LRPRIKKMLLRLANENPGVRGKFRMAAGIVHKGHLVATGVNSYKTHPIMTNGGYKEEQIHLHAEADAIRKALSLLSPSDLAKSDLYVVRVKKDGSEALAKPCRGCQGLVSTFNIRSVEWTE